MIIKELTEREQIVLQARYEGRTLDSIGQELGLTRSRVGQIEATAEHKLFESIDSLKLVSPELKYRWLCALKSKLESQLEVIDGILNR